MRLFQMFLVVLAMLCSPQATAESADEYEYHYFAIEYRPFGSNDGYQLRMFADGTAIYWGNAGNKEVGYRVIHRSPEVFEKVSALLLEEKFQRYDKGACKDEEAQGRHFSAYLIEDRTRDLVRGEGRSNIWEPKIVVGGAFCPKDKFDRFLSIFNRIAKWVEVEELTGTYEEKEAIEHCENSFSECLKANRERLRKGAAEEWWRRR